MLQKASKQQQIAQWIQDWEKIYDETIKLSISDIDEISSLYDFLNTIRLIEETYVAAQKFLIEYAIKREDETLIMKKLIENFRNHVRLIRMLATSEKNTSHSAFAILQGESPDQSFQKEGGKSEKTDKSEKKCLCDFFHVWFKCYYLIPTNRSAD